MIQAELNFSGATFNPTRDRARLAKQLTAVRELMLDGVPRTLKQIHERTGAPEASASARLRDLRAQGFTVERKFIERGLYEYTVRTA